MARALTVFPLSQHFDRSWAAHVAVKAALAEAEAEMQAGAQHRLDDDVNKEITRLKARGRSLLPLRACCPLLFSRCGQGAEPQPPMRQSVRVL